MAGDQCRDGSVSIVQTWIIWDVKACSVALLETGWPLVWGCQVAISSLFDFSGPRGWIDFHVPSLMQSCCSPSSPANCRQSLGCRKECIKMHRLPTRAAAWGAGRVSSWVPLYPMSSPSRPRCYPYLCAGACRLRFRRLKEKLDTAALRVP